MPWPRRTHAPLQHVFIPSVECRVRRARWAAIRSQRRHVEFRDGRGMFDIRAPGVRFFVTGKLTGNEHHVVM